MFSFLPLTNNSVTIGLRFLLLSISAIISSRTINDLRFFLNYIIQYFYKYQPYHLSILIKSPKPLKLFNPVLSSLLIKD